MSLNLEFPCSAEHRQHLHTVQSESHVDSIPFRNAIVGFIIYYNIPANNWREWWPCYCSDSHRLPSLQCSEKEITMLDIWEWSRESTATNQRTNYYLLSLLVSSVLFFCFYFMFNKIKTRIHSMQRCAWFIHFNDQLTWNLNISHHLHKEGGKKKQEERPVGKHTIVSPPMRTRQQ